MLVHMMRRTPTVASKHPVLTFATRCQQRGAFDPLMLRNVIDDNCACKAAAAAAAASIATESS